MLNEDLLNIFAQSFRYNWELPALQDYGSSSVLTYGDLARRIARTHIFFRLNGVKPGAKIAVMGKNSVSWIVSYMATVTYGAVVVPILHDFNPQDAQHIINHSDTSMLFVQDYIWEHFNPEQLPGVKVAMSLDTNEILMEKESEKGKAKKAMEKVVAEFNRKYPKGFNREDVAYMHFSPDTLAEINYTSGTTGFSKGVMLTLNNLCGNVVYGLNSGLQHRKGRCLAFLPLAHTYGCTFDMLTQLAVGALVVTFNKVPSPRVLMAALAEVKPTLVLCVPLILEKIYQKQILPVISKPSMRRLMALPFINKKVYKKIRSKLMEAFGGEFNQIIVGGAPLNPEVEAFLYKIDFPFAVGYGMTECGPLISFTPYPNFIPGSSGRTLRGLMFSKVLSDNGAIIPGEICVKGENVMMGYYKNTEATKAVLDSEGWLHTGDMGTIADAGTIFIRGRYKTMILSASGQNIYPEEIEAKLNTMPYVAESLVLQRGKKIVAIVYPDVEAMDKAHLRHGMMPAVMEKVRQEVNRLLASYEQINEIEVRSEEFEKTPKRSIKRYLYS
ncbi:MAG: AMP-binding protein [Paramuribaculum sp.]|jgi:long-chain acyl-CoA synthetase